MWIIAQLAFGQGGVINSFTVLPQNPTTNDTIRILADCTFTSGGCEAMSLTTSQAGTTINAIANHCLGPLTVICNKTDSFVILPQPQGNYKFIMNLYTGGAAPCNMNFADQDSVSFIVTSVTSIDMRNEMNKGLHAFYQNGVLHIISSPEQFKNAELRITSLSGQVVFSGNCINQTKIPLELSNGIYIISMQNQSGRISAKLLVE